jgi:hypothetical protein
MNGFWAVCKRELKGYFATPVAYVFLVIFLFFAGYLTFKGGFFETGHASMYLFFSNLPLLFVFMVPSTAMRLWSEERRSGSIEVLMSLPITVTGAVLAGNGVLSGRSGHWAYRDRLSGELSDGRDVFGYRMLFFGVDEEPGSQLYLSGGDLCGSGICGDAYDVKLFIDVLAGGDAGGR